MSEWLMVLDTRSGEVLSAPPVTAMTSFDALDPATWVWCADGDGEARPVQRRHLGVM